MAQPKRVEDALVRKWRRSLDSLQTFFEQGVRCKDYVAGRQWTEEERRALLQRNQAPVVYNQLAPMRRFVMSMFEAMKRSITVLPRHSSDTEKAWMMAQVIDAVYDINDVDTKRLWVLRDAFDTGIGWWMCGRNPDLTEDPLLIDYVPWKEIIWDVGARQLDLRDASFIARVKWASFDDVKEMFPEYRKQIEWCLEQPVWMPEDAMASPGVVDENDRTPRRAWIDRTQERVQLMEWWEYRYEKIPCVTQGDVLVPYDEDLHAQAVAQGQAALVDAPVKVPWVRFIVGPYQLYEGRSPYKHYAMPFVPAIFDWDDEMGMPRGMVSDLIDPQDEINKRRSKAIHFLNMNQVIMDEGAVASLDDLREELADPEGIIVKRPNRAFEVLRNLDLAKGHLDLMMEALQEIRLISGVFQDAVGQPTNARTGAAIQARQQGTQTSLVLFMKNAASAERRVALQVMSLIQQYYRSSRVFRITDQKGQVAFLELNKSVVDPMTGQVVVENSLAHLQADLSVNFRLPMATERQAMSQHISEVMKGAPPPLMPVLMNLWLEFLDVPRKDELRQQLMTQAQGVADARRQMGIGAAGPARGPGGPAAGGPGRGPAPARRGP